MGGWFAENWGWLAGLAGTGGGGTILAKLHSRHLGHREATRKQTDDAVMSTNHLLAEQLKAANERMDRMNESSDREAQLCAAKLDALSAKLGAVEGRFDAMLLAIKFAPDKAADIIADLASWQTRHREEDARHEGEARNLSQAKASAENLAARPDQAGD